MTLSFAGYVYVIINQVSDVMNALFTWTCMFAVWEVCCVVECPALNDIENFSPEPDGVLDVAWRHRNVQRFPAPDSVVIEGYAD